MKKHLLIFTLLSIIAFTSCALNHKTNSKKAPQKGITRIIMSRGACFGRCPIYSLDISNNGKTTYEGRQFTSFPGTYEKEFSPKQVAAIFSAFNKYRVDTCQQEYFVNIADFPGLNFTLEVNGRTKEIRNAGFGPHFMNELGKLVDQTIQVDSSWKKTGEMAE